MVKSPLKVRVVVVLQRLQAALPVGMFLSYIAG